MKRIALCLLSVVAGALSTAGWTISSERLKILVGPNILVSRDGDVPHVETAITVNPKHPKGLLGTAITFTRPDGSAACKVYVSNDGGYTWSDAAIPEQVEFGGFDPQVAFGPQGTAFFVALAPPRGIDFYRSEDGGKNWQKPVNLGTAYDHEMLIVDQSSGKYAGRIYISAENVRFSRPNDFSSRKSTVQLFRSEDDGRTFLPPVEIAISEGKGLMAENMLVLSDGTLFVSLREYPNPPVDRITPTHTFLFAVSSDGGDSFSAPRKIHESYFGGWGEYYKRTNDGEIDITVGSAVYAVDTQTKKDCDRLYVAWSERRTGSNRIFFSYSSDRGKGWSPPKLVDSDVPAEAVQYQPTIAVNNEGVVGISWFDTRGSRNREHYNLYFTASVDGGRSFLPAVRVSSEPSFPGGAGNMFWTPARVSSTAQSVNTTFLSAFSRWRQGGEYVGLAVDDRGVFHPFYPDSRSGTFQLWTSQIRVIRAGANNDPPADRVKKSINQKVSLFFDPIRYDAARREMLLPVRIKNTSQETLYGPFTVEIKSLIDPKLATLGVPLGELQILNAANGKRGMGAVFDYSTALRDFTSLEPGALTEAVSWRLKTAGAPLSFQIQADVTGYVSQKN